MGLRADPHCSVEVRHLGTAHTALSKHQGAFRAKGKCGPHFKLYMPLVSGFNSNQWLFDHMSSSMQPAPITLPVALFELFFATCTYCLAGGSSRASQQRQSHRFPQICRSGALQELPHFHESMSRTMQGGFSHLYFSKLGCKGKVGGGTGGGGRGHAG